MRNVDHTVSSSGDQPNEAEQVVDLARRQRRSRFVEDKDAAVGSVPIPQRSRDRDTRPLDRRRPPKRDVDIEIDVELPKELRRPPGYLATIDTSQAGAYVSGDRGDVVYGAKLGDYSEVLVDKPQSRARSVLRGANLEGCPIDPALSFAIRLMKACEDLDQR
jgi:hypothetical protein